MRRPDLLKRLWQSERGLSAMLVFLVLAIFVVAPLVASEAAGSLWFDLSFALLLLSGVVFVSRKWMHGAATLVLVIATLALRWAENASDSKVVSAASHVLSIASLAIFAWLVLIQVFREGPITSQRIQGAVAVYLLLGVIWLVAYDLVYKMVPGAFRFADGADETTHHLHDLAYYSFITLTTIGYGDIVPAHPAARSLAMAEGLLGQLYPAILIARLVSMQIESRRKS
ncbi:MAG TPA: ion channel [Thermoanaerobaculia bacterium]|nr:ion channel [Thermoanaerobaculia bacterium]